MRTHGHGRKITVLQAVESTRDEYGVKTATYQPAGQFIGFIWPETAQEVIDGQLTEVHLWKGLLPASAVGQITRADLVEIDDNRELRVETVTERHAGSTLHHVAITLRESA